MCSYAVTEGSVYPRWGHRECPSGATTLYSGYMSSAHYGHRGSGANTLCLHPDGQLPQGANAGNQNGNLLYGVRLVAPDAGSLPILEARARARRASGADEGAAPPGPYSPRLATARCRVGRASPAPANLLRLLPAAAKRSRRGAIRQPAFGNHSNPPPPHVRRRKRNATQRASRPPPSRPPPPPLSLPSFVPPCQSSQPSPSPPPLPLAPPSTPAPPWPLSPSAGARPVPAPPPQPQPSHSDGRPPPQPSPPLLPPSPQPPSPTFRAASPTRTRF